jgi:hypothetical protein
MARRVVAVALLDLFFNWEGRKFNGRERERVMERAGSVPCYPLCMRLPFLRCLSSENWVAS